ncbi:hypothetical protein TVAG_411750 [Trichomonas vaginalis G3]|uniref:Uncharacterized protein n=1 Tax=Trichomonas vaginalis (strain ATCC PRA-98 / G3) TaxID=412133 RepID=A2FB83_TRIV3|nr:hypothetical protein TVAGG3_0995360 [Trichomonas vaginalis G3]EAX97813.1 hypothetical protein TVAG_411750 [Trichomonas vaginalis G3]KAI5490345.1 hypothetical protein TVAGG3_0995360 [Trichomonas vaginalis G3]|eukprot:XP_001310743.1 hypothetical protein [Trichomonas vaginalis G3]
MSGEFLDKQEDLDELTAQYIERNGGNNLLYAEYLRMTADLAAESDATVFNHLEPDIKYTVNDKAFMEALKYCIAFLKSNKMVETLATMRTEYPELPNKTGYARRTEIERSWENMLETSHKLGQRKFEKTVKNFANELGLEDYQPKKFKKSAEQASEEKKRSHHHHH